MIFGISGKINSGKDLTGEMIQYIGEMGVDAKFLDFEINQNEKLITPIWKIRKFADLLKDIVCLILGCTREQLENREYKEKPLGKEWWKYKDNLLLEKLTPRKILLLIGSDFGRRIVHNDIWVNTAMAEYDYEKEDNWIFTDMRFPNEMAAVTDRDGITIRVERDITCLGTDDSEIALDDSLDKFDYIINNNGTKEELFNKCLKIMKKLNLIK